MWGEQELVLLMVFSCLMNYGFGLWINASSNKKPILSLGVFLNLALLGYFKYVNFFVDNFNAVIPEQWRISILPVALPIGISFFTFQSISYLVDLYRKEVQVQRDPIKLSLYVALFPQLIAGPIVRYHDIAKAITNRIHSSELFVSGIQRFVIGLSKKMLIANVLAQIVTEVMTRNPGEMNAPIIWFGMLCFGMQVYYDFSGYSDMAIGLGRMFGFRFLENFNFPFVARTIREFWQRWHISLSSWFRDYLYIPMGGSRGSSGRVYFNLITIFFLMGLWHGANWNYIVWAMYYGFFIIIERQWLAKFMDKHKVLGHIYFFVTISTSWVLFNIESPTVQRDFYWVMFTGGNNPDIGFWPNTEQIFIFIIAHFFAFNGVSLFKQFNDRFIKIERFPALTKSLSHLGILALFILCLMALSSNAYNPFLYYRF